LVPLFVTSDGIGGTDGFGGAVPLTRISMQRIVPPAS
jgi:hypothetical protein